MTSLPPFDPYAILAALERRHVAYVLIGAFARVIHGTEERTDGVDLAPSLRPENLRRLALALDDLGAQQGGRTATALDVATLRAEPVQAVEGPHGELKIVPEPAGTRRGYDDLRRAATREPLGRGLRPPVASLPDLARTLAALVRDEDRAALRQLRQLRELEQSLGRGLGR